MWENNWQLSSGPGRACSCKSFWPLSIIIQARAIPPAFRCLISVMVMLIGWDLGFAQRRVSDGLGKQLTTGYARLRVQTSVDTWI
jgi:hypothetical protein